MKLIGISGTNGAGKDSVAEILQSKRGFLFVSVSDLLRTEAEKRGLTTEREHLRDISSEWRREDGLGVLVDKAVEHYRTKGGDSKYSGLVVASIRNSGEADRIHELDGSLVWVDANPKLRYDRISSRERADDSKTYEQFMQEEQAEMKRSGDSATLSMGEVKEKADKIISNEVSGLKELESIVVKRLGDVL